MITLAEIQENLTRIWDLMVEINIAAENATRLAISNYKNEDRIKNHGFFKYYLFQQKFVLAIKLCILFEDKSNQKFNFIKLLRRLESEKYNEELEKFLKCNKYITKPGREGVIEEIKILNEIIHEHETIIRKISNVRNKNYSHLDPDRNNQGTTIEEYKIVVDLANKVYNKLSLIFRESTTFFDKLSSWSVDSILRSLTENYNNWFDSLDKKN